MQEKLIVKEKKAPVWRTVLTGSLIATIICTILFIWSADPLWTSIFQLLAFAGFAMIVLIYLQTRGNEWEMELELSKEQLIVNYFHQSNKNQEEFFERETIDTITRVENPMVWTILPAGDCEKIMISFTDTPNTLSLFRIEGRDLMIAIEDAQKLERYLEQTLSNLK